MRSYLTKIALILFLAAVPSLASAGTEHNMMGYAWSSNIGWISFNSLNENPAAGANYGVNLNVDNTLTGYAWSPNAGWIKFGSLSGFPTGGGTQLQNANLNGTNLKGWIRFCAGMNDATVSPTNQTGANETCGGWTRTDGWDGWMSLSGASYSVDLTGTSFTGYSWGGPVIGWVMWNPQSLGICLNCGVNLNGTADFDIKVAGNSISGRTDMPYGTTPTFQWTLTNMAAGTSCSVTKTSSGGTAFTPITGIASSGSEVGSAHSDAAYSYKMDCVKDGVILTTETVSFTVLPVPAGFSLGSPSEQVRIQALSSGNADSEQKNIFVTKTGSFSSQVSVSITGVPTPIASTTFSYSLDGGQSYGASPTGIISSPYDQGLGFKVRVTRLSGAPALTGPYTVTLTGSAAGFPSSNKEMIIMPVTLDPEYEEL